MGLLKKIGEHKKQIFVHSLFFISIIALSALLEGFVFNAPYFFRNENEKQNYSLESWNYKREKNDNKTDKIKLDFRADSFVDKIKINYKTNTTESIPAKITYGAVREYDIERNETIETRIGYDFHEEYFRVNGEITSLSLVGDIAKDDEFQIESVEILNGYYFNFLRMFFCFVVILTTYILFRFWQKGFSAEKLHVYFAVFATILGASIIILQPASTFISLDDETHFGEVLRIIGGKTEYNLSEWKMIGHVRNMGLELPNTAEEQKYREGVLDEEDDILGDYFTASTRLKYTKVAYLPMAIGYYLPKALGLPFTWCFRIGKIFNLLLYIAIMAYAIKIARVGKKFLFVLALMPTSIFLASNYSYDPCVTSGLALFFVELINILCRSEEEKVTKKEMIIMLASMFYACAAKAIYVPFLLLIFFIPKNKYKNKKEKNIFRVLTVGLAFAIVGVILLSTILTKGAGDPRGGDTSVVDQVVLVLTHPLDYLTVLKNNFGRFFANKLLGNSTLGQWGYRGVIPDNLYFLYFILMLFTAMLDNKNNKLSKWFRATSVLLSVVVMVLVWSALYAAYTPVGSTIINGVQNRYFIPFLFLLGLCLQSKNIVSKIPEKYSCLAITVVPVFTIICSTAALIFNVLCL